MAMDVIYVGQEIDIYWSIRRNASEVLEDFSKADLRVFLTGNDFDGNYDGKYYFANTIDAQGRVKLVIDAGSLTPGTYCIEGIWIKNSHELLNSGWTRSISRARKDRIFKVSDVEDECTDYNEEEGHVVVASHEINIATGTTSYGYDGMSAYETAIFNGSTAKTEKEWIDTYEKAEDRVNYEMDESHDGSVPGEPQSWANAELLRKKAEGQLGDSDPDYSTSRQKKEEDRQTAESNRASAETSRGTAETQRQKNEGQLGDTDPDYATSRIKKENDRQTAESGRVIAENGRIMAEATRVRNEGSGGPSSAGYSTSRIKKELDRQSAESSRATAETSRQEYEGQGDYSDTTEYPNTRRAKEAARQTAETSRATAETARQKAEGQLGDTDPDYATSRIKQEIDRQAAEAARELAETARENAKISSTTIEYAVGDSGTTPPSSGWQASIPSYTTGDFLWGRTTMTFGDGTSKVLYAIGSVPDVAVSQNASTGKTTITVGSDSYDVATEPVSVSQNSETGHADIKVGNTTTPVASVEEIGVVKTITIFNGELTDVAGATDRPILLSESVAEDTPVSLTFDNIVINSIRCYDNNSDYHLTRPTILVENNGTSFLLPKGTGVVVVFFDALEDTTHYTIDLTAYNLRSWGEGSWDKIDLKVGNLIDLLTTNKDDVVSAINEVASSVSEQEQVTGKKIPDFPDAELVSTITHNVPSGTSTEVLGTLSLSEDCYGYIVVNGVDSGELTFLDVNYRIIQRVSFLENKNVPVFLSKYTKSVALNFSSQTTRTYRIVFELYNNTLYDSFRKNQTESKTENVLSTLGKPNGNVDLNSLGYTQFIRFVNGAVDANTIHSACLNYIPCIGGSEITLDIDSDYEVRIFYYSDTTESSFITQTTFINPAEALTTPLSARYFRICFREAAQQSVPPQDIHDVVNSISIKTFYDYAEKILDANITKILDTHVNIAAGESVSTFSLSFGSLTNDKYAYVQISGNCTLKFLNSSWRVVSSYDLSAEQITPILIPKDCPYGAITVPSAVATSTRFDIIIISDTLETRTKDNSSSIAVINSYIEQHFPETELINHSYTIPSGEYRYTNLGISSYSEYIPAYITLSGISGSIQFLGYAYNDAITYELENGVETYIQIPSNRPKIIISTENNIPVAQNTDFHLLLKVVRGANAFDEYQKRVDDRKYIPVLQNMNRTKIDPMTNNPSLSYKTLVLQAVADPHDNLLGVSEFLAFNDRYKDYIDDMIGLGDYYSGGLNITPFRSPEINNWGKIIKSIGNHDAYDDWPQHTVASESTVYDEVLAREPNNPDIASWGVTYQQNKTYFYKDYEDANVRVVFLDYMHWDDSTDADGQIAWLRSILGITDGTAISKHVLVVVHSRPQSNNSGSFVRYENSSWTDKDFNGRDDETVNSLPDIIKDFQVLGGTFIAYLCGHAHISMVGKLQNYEQLIYVQQTACPSAIRPNGYTFDTDWIKQFCIYSIDTEVQYLRIYKVGTPFDRNMQHLGSLLLKYGGTVGILSES